MAAVTTLVEPGQTEVVVDGEVVAAIAAALITFVAVLVIRYCGPATIAVVSGVATLVFLRRTRP